MHPQVSGSGFQPNPHSFARLGWNPEKIALLPNQAITQSMSYRFAAELFDWAYEKVVNEIHFSLSWVDDDGYLDGLLRDNLIKVAIRPGQVAKCQDADGRKIIIMGYLNGLVVIFQRYTGDSHTLVCQATHEVVEQRKLINGSRLNYEELRSMFTFVNAASV